jgi:N-methylhydantoinase A
VYFPEAGGYIACPVYNRYQLRTGTSIEGPAMIEERDSTTVVLPTQVAELHATGNLIVTSTKRAG